MTSSNDLDLTSQILEYLKTNSHKYANSREIAEALSMSRSKVYDCISSLREYGYQIEASRNRGYKLEAIPDLIQPVEIAAGLKCKVMGSRVICFQSIGSTNTTARKLAREGLPEGTLIISEKQTSGRGRLGRKWHSPPGKGLYFSLILKPNLPPDKTTGLSLVAGLAIVRAVRKLHNIDLQTKWPNDIMFKNRKLAGILIELVAELDRVEYVVAGIGMNINLNSADFPLSLRRKTTSLNMILNKEVDRLDILKRVLEEFEGLYKNYCIHGLKYIGGELVQNSALINKRVSLRQGKVRITGQVLGFDDAGGLLIKTKKETRAYSAGEVSFR